MNINGAMEAIVLIDVPKILDTLQLVFTIQVEDIKIETTNCLMNEYYNNLI